MKGLKETIQDYYNAMNGSWDESDYQMLAWLEELRDLRTILNKCAPGEEKAAKMEDCDNFDGPMTLDEATGYFDSWPAQLDIEEQERFWLNQLLEARNRVEKDASKWHSGDE